MKSCCHSLSPPDKPILHRLRQIEADCDERGPPSHIGKTVVTQVPDLGLTVIGGIRF